MSFHAWAPSPAELTVSDPAPFNPDRFALRWPAEDVAQDLPLIFPLWAHSARQVVEALLAGGQALAGAAPLRQVMAVYAEGDPIEFEQLVLLESHQIPAMQVPARFAAPGAEQALQQHVAEQFRLAAQAVNETAYTGHALPGFEDAVPPAPPMTAEGAQRLSRSINEALSSPDHSR